MPAQAALPQTLNPDDGPAPAPGPSPQELLLAELVSEGMGEGQTRVAVRDHYDMAVYQLANLRHVLPSEKILPSRGGWLYKAVTTGYGPTKGYQQFLETQKAEQKRREAQARDQAAHQARIEAERVSFDAVEQELTPEEEAALRQRARNCVHPDFRKRGEAKCANMIEVNYKALLAGEERKEYKFWPAPGSDDGGGNEGEG